jgi:hypothetical protein
MAGHPCVVLYGNSVFLAGIRADLMERTPLELLTIEADSPDAAGLIARLRPAAFLFDLAAAQPDFAVALLREQPDLLLIGVDPSRDEVLVLSGHATQARNLVDLIGVIRRDKSPTGEAGGTQARQSDSVIVQGCEGAPAADRRS